MIKNIRIRAALPGPSADPKGWLRGVSLRFVPLCLCAFVPLLATVASADVSNPVGSGRVPPVGGQSGLVESPNPIDTAGNLVITGNVTGGRHFRGNVPYSGHSDLQATLGSSTLDSFLRRSIPADDSGPHSGPYVPFYSPGASVSRTLPGRRTVIGPQTGWRPGLSWQGLGGGLRRVNQLKDTDTASLKLNSAGRIERSPYTGLVQKGKDLSQQRDPDEKRLNTLAEDKDTGRQERIDPDVPHSPEQTSLLQTEAETIAVAEAMAEITGGDQVRIKSKSSNLKEILDRLEAVAAERQQDKQALSDETGDISDPAKIQESDLSARARAILGDHKDVDSYVMEQYSRHMDQADEFLHGGKFYAAADIYAMALVYKAGDPGACAGRGYAFFAAGEYASAALFIARAIEGDAGMLDEKIDIAELFGGRDIFENRLLDLEKWHTKRGSEELGLLLGYFYHVAGRNADAALIMDKLCLESPQWRAAELLRAAVYRVSGRGESGL